MENVYRERGINADPFDWTSSHRDTHDSPHQIIHLHGFVDRSSTPDEMARKLIFSFSDYASSVSDPQAWHTVFTSEFADLPFIILGATLSEEFDLIQALRSGSNSDSVRGLPSIIVLSSVSDFHRDELNSYGLQVVEADAHTFMQKLKATFQQLQLVLGEEYGHPLTPELSRFLQQFVDLRRYEPIPNADRHDFYAGYEPLWSDIQADDDSIIETTERSFSSITDSFAAEEGSQQIHLLTGRSGTGKSTGLLRIAQHAISQGKSPFIYREDEALDVKATIAWLNAAPNTVLFFDNCGEFAESLMNLATECEATGISLLVIGAERNIRRKHLQDKIAGRFLRMTPDYEYRSLTNRDIEALIVKLDRRGRLGQLTRISQPGRRNYFIREASRLLFDGMAGLEGGQGFQDRIRGTYQHLGNEPLKTIYAASSISYSLGYPLTMGLASQMTRLPARHVREILAYSRQDVMVVTPQGIRPPHRITARRVVEYALAEEEKFDIVQQLLFALAPHVDKRASQTRTRHYRLLARLMDMETIVRLAGTEKCRQIYESIQDAYDWNGRYWEQRALYESSLENHTRARSYAERSLRLSPHPFAFNTLGTILGRIAIDNADPDTLGISIDALRSARDARNWDASEHPYITFFSTMIRYGQNWGLASIPMTVQYHWLDWHQRARQEVFFSHARGIEQLQNFQGEWRRLSQSE